VRDALREHGGRALLEGRLLKALSPNDPTNTQSGAIAEPIGAPTALDTTGASAVPAAATVTQTVDGTSDESSVASVRVDPTTEDMLPSPTELARAAMDAVRTALACEVERRVLTLNLGVDVQELLRVCEAHADMAAQDFYTKVLPLVRKKLALPDATPNRSEVVKACEELNIDPPEPREPVDERRMRRTFHELAKAYHPDTGGPGGEFFTRIATAYRVLRAYNDSLAPEAPPPSSGGAAGGHSGKGRRGGQNKGSARKATGTKASFHTEAGALDESAESPSGGSGEIAIATAPSMSRPAPAVAVESPHSRGSGDGAPVEASATDVSRQMASAPAKTALIPPNFDPTTLAPVPTDGSLRKMIVVHDTRDAGAGLVEATGYLGQYYTHTLSPSLGCAYARNLCGIACIAQFATPARVIAAGLGLRWGEYLFVRDTLPEKVERDLRAACGRPADHPHHISRIKIFMSASTEPGAGPALEVTRGLLRVFARYPIGRLVLQTRAPEVLKLLPALKALGDRVIVSLTVESDNDALWSDFKPPMVPRIRDRREAVEQLASQGITVNVAVSPCSRLRDPEGFADWIAQHATYCVVDAYTTGNGKGASCTGKTKLPVLYEERGLVWNDETAARTLYAHLLQRMGDRALWSEEGFNALATVPTRPAPRPAGPMNGSIKTKRWNDPGDPDDGFRLVVCRYRPRGVRKSDETWDAWWPNLGPSKDLHAAFYGKHGPPIGWGEYVRRYLNEVAAQQSAITMLAERVAAGDTITLLCSSACTDEQHCHRTLLEGLIMSTASQLHEQTDESACR
jgi:uncharacterized protein YeaO (DUF488 family)